jgi:hypothetical protein
MRRIVTIAAVASVLLGLTMFVQPLRADEPDAEHAKRQAALSWAIDHGEQAFELVFAPATRRDVVLPVCRIVTLRPGHIADDFREFRIEIIQLCDGTIRKADVSVARTPVVVQLAQMRLRENELTLVSAIPRLLVDHRDLGPDSALRILRSLERVRLAPNPTYALILDVPSFEVNVVSWGEVRILTYLEDRRPGWRELGAMLTEAMRLSKIDINHLRYDPEDIER